MCVYVCVRAHARARARVRARGYQQPHVYVWEYVVGKKKKRGIVSGQNSHWEPCCIDKAPQ